MNSKENVGRKCYLMLLLVPWFTSTISAQEWSQLHPIGNPPSARDFHSAVYDGETNRVVVFGGRNAAAHPCQSLNDTWVLTGANGLEGAPAWTQTTPAGVLPPPRIAHTAVFEPSSNTMIVFGGLGSPCSGTGFLNDVWVLSNANATEGSPSTWTPLFPAGSPPAARLLHAAAYDAATNRMMIFGGGAAGGLLLSDVWVLSNANNLGGTPEWTQLSPTGTPPQTRDAPTVVFDPASNRLVLFGGRTAGEVRNNDVWVLTNANGLGGPAEWMQLLPVDAPPAPRTSHSAVYDLTTNRMVVFGGNGNATFPFFDDVWVLTNANGLDAVPKWVSLTPNILPAARAEHEATLDIRTNRMIVFGGASPTVSTGVLNDVWVLENANGILRVSIDIKPGSNPNSVNLGSGGTLPVAILSTLQFDAREVDPLSITLAGAQVRLKGKGTPMTSIEDVDGDGLLDLVVHVSTEALQLSGSDTEAILCGQTFAGKEIRGTDSVRIVP